MRNRPLIIFSFILLILAPSIFSCSSAKDIEERKNLMLPKKSEMMRNSRYKEVEKRKVNKHKQHKRKNKKLF